MQLEVLAPRTWTHPVKEFLRGWYTRIGYRQIRTARPADAHPALQPRLATVRLRHLPQEPVAERGETAVDRGRGDPGRARTGVVMESVTD